MNHTQYLYICTANANFKLGRYLIFSVTLIWPWLLNDMNRSGYYDSIYGILSFSIAELRAKSYTI
jgi:hypothetical protein